MPTLDSVAKGASLATSIVTLFEGLARLGGLIQKMVKREGSGLGLATTAIAQIPVIQERWGRKATVVQTLANAIAMKISQGLSKDEIMNTFRTKLESLVNVPIVGTGGKLGKLTVNPTGRITGSLYVKRRVGRPCAKTRRKAGGKVILTGGSSSSKVILSKNTDPSVIRKLGGGGRKCTCGGKLIKV